MRGTKGVDKVKESGVVMEYSQRISRETSESAYSWDSDRFGKTDIVDNGISVDYN